MKTLITYGTRGGATRTSAQILASELNSKWQQQVELRDASELRHIRKSISGYDAVIIGSSIRSGRWVGRCLSLLKKLDDPDQKVFVFVSAGGTMNKVDKYGISRDEARREAIGKYIDTLQQKYKLSITGKNAFGGWVKRKDSYRYNSWEKEEVISWAKEIGERCS